MWQKLISWARLLWDAGEEMQRIRTEVKDLHTGQSDSNELIRVLAIQNELLRKDNEMLRGELRHERETRAAELEKLELRLRLQLSEELRRLPPGD